METHISHVTQTVQLIVELSLKGGCENSCLCRECVVSGFPPRAQNYWVVVHGRRSLTQNIGCFRQRALSLIFRGFGPYDGHVSAGECARRVHCGNSQHSVRTKIPGRAVRPLRVHVSG